MYLGQPSFVFEKRKTTGAKEMDPYRGESGLEGGWLGLYSDVWAMFEREDEKPQN